MNKTFSAAILAGALCASTSVAMASDIISESRTVDARTTKVKLGGVVELQLKQGSTAGLVLHGEKELIAKVTTTQNGDTIVIDMEKMRSFSWGGNKHLKAELTLPNLQEFVSTGVGAANVSGFAGDSIKLVLDGAGSITMAANKFKNLNARLGGVGNMELEGGDMDKVDLSLRGAGHIEIKGNSKSLNAKLGGVGSLEAQDLRADAVELDMTGLGGAKVYAKNSANLHLTGLGSATVYGKPAQRTSNARGLGSVSWE